jgi:hypothetical protein
VAGELVAAPLLERFQAFMSLPERCRYAETVVLLADAFGVEAEREARHAQNVRRVGSGGAG